MHQRERDTDNKCWKEEQAMKDEVPSMSNINMVLRNMKRNRHQEGFASRHRSVGKREHLFSTCPYRV